MCCLFGMMDYGNNFTGKQKSRMIYTLAVEAEARGTDATGIAYNSRGRLRIYKPYSFDEAEEKRGAATCAF